VVGLFEATTGAGETALERVLAGLNEAQAYAAGLGEGPILVIAGAGSGKTRTLVHRVARLVAGGVPPSAILLLTFTRRAAAEMLLRARELWPASAGVEGGTFHSLCHRLLRQHGERLGLARNFTIIDRADSEQILRGLVEEKGLKQRGDKRFPKSGTLADLISKSRNLEKDLMTILAEQASHLMPYAQAVLDVAAAFALAKREQQLVDYDDLLYLAEELLTEHPGVRQALGERWRYILVDEYQDTNAVQARLVELLAGPRKSVMAVGDDAQSIYRFRGARLKNILEFPKRFSGTRLVKLEQNYRSTQAILDLTNQIIAGATERYDKRLFTELGQGVSPELIRPRDERGQSRMIMERIRSLITEGVSPEEIAVLMRASNDSYDLEVELTAEGLAYLKHGGKRFLEAAHIKDALAHLRVAMNPRDHLAWQRLLMLLPGVGPKKAQQVLARVLTDPAEMDAAQALAAWPEAVKGPQFAELTRLMALLCSPGLEPLEAVEAVLAYYEPLCREAYEDHPRRLRDLGELPGLARPYLTLAEFMSEVALDPPAAQGEEVSGPKLTLSTIHSAKGLEWAHVFVLWACDGRLPSFPSLGEPEALEEERRLLYVACTRARATLTLSAPREYYGRGQGLMPMRRSRFLEDLPPRLVHEDQASRPVFAVPEPAPTPSSRGSQRQNRPFAVGTRVAHSAFGGGKVMGYQGDKKIIVHFDRLGLKILLLEFAGLQPA
jgi:DNA helicase-2/ATP-dependent DNA helicase PcrA